MACDETPSRAAVSRSITSVALRALGLLVGVGVASSGIVRILSSSRWRPLVQLVRDCRARSVY